MANMDAVLDFMFTQPKHPNGVRKRFILNGIIMKID